MSPLTRTALITAYKVEDYVYNAKLTGVFNIIAKTAPFDFNELSRVVNNLIEPASAFGLEHYLKQSSSVEHFTIASSHDIMQAYALLKTYLSDDPIQLSSSQVNDLLTALVEAMTNAVYHVHRKEDGSLKYEKGHPIDHLERDEQVEITYGHDADVVGISIADQGGGMNASDILYWLERNISGAGLMDTHGRGVYLMHRLADRLLINIAPGERTEIILFHYLTDIKNRTANKPIYINQF
jgi:anti-sigma regulatory factor (Ser/Thr protein kinase)